MARLFGLTHLRVLITVLIAVIAGSAATIRGSEINPADGLFYDLALALSPERPGRGGEPVAVVAMDEASLGTPELAPLPRIFFGPLWAKVLEGLASNGAKAIGFDIIFSYSADRFPGLKDGQYDRSFLEALLHHRDKVVLARSRHTFPVQPFWIAAGPGALALAELVPDPDGIHRRAAPVLHTSDGKSLPTIAGALLRRAGGPPMPDPMLLAPAEPLESIPTYRLIDVVRCIDSDPAALRRAFDGKVVLIGSNLPEEDRKRTPDRFMKPPPFEPGAKTGCSLRPLGASDAPSRTTPGMFIHAEAVKEVLTGDIVHPMARWGRAFAAVVLAIAGTGLGFLTRPWVAALSGTCLGGLAFATEVVLLGTGIWFPVAVPAVSGAVATAIAYVVRFVVEERRGRRVQEAFDHYLHPDIVKQLAESENELRLGGEEREVTVMFADLSGFTSLSGRVAPRQLMELTNTYLGYIVHAVEASGGYVDKFIGDAVMGVWGAPVPNPHHAAAAARAALRAVEAVMRAKREADARGEPGYSVKIGLNSGPAVVGNVGAPQRYNYTAIGETVNIAARLESVPEDYGCRIVVGPQTAAAIEGEFVLCELDWIKVKGKQDAIAIYELISERATAEADELDYARLYHNALERYRAGDFAGARDRWCKEIRHPEVIGAVTSPPEIMAARCSELLASPPPEWDGVFVKTSK